MLSFLSTKPLHAFGQKGNGFASDSLCSLLSVFPLRLKPRKKGF
jgi:hypothetical protein